MKKVRVEKTVGMVLAHDITRIIPGKFKGVGFKKGHVVQKQDIYELIRLGKNYLYVLDISKGHIHEDDAALKIAGAICSDTLRWTSPVEGKTSIISKKDGLLKINTNGLLRINKMGNIIVSTIKSNFPCKKDQTVAATRIIPLTISTKKIEKLENTAKKYYPVIQILPYKKLKIGAVITGTEIYKGLIHDGFDEYVGSIIQSYGCKVVSKSLVPDEPGAIAGAILKLIDIGCDMIITTGGLSVDPDDVTKKGVQKTGAKLIAYGSPVLPGAMFLYAFLDDVPILGLPACVYYHKATIFNLIFPRVLAGDKITKNEIAEMGHGGLCMNCSKCRFPVCPFGK